MCSVEELKKQLEEKDLIIKALKEELKREATIDMLTGLLNKSAIDKILELEVGKAERSFEPFSILIVNVAHFNKISEEINQTTSDTILADIGLKMQGFLRKQDIISRWGRDDFLVILPETNKTQARNVEEALLQELRGYSYLLNGEEIPCAIRTGVARYTIGENINECILRAEKEIRE